MTSLRLNERQRLDLLAGVVLDHLEERYSESELELNTDLSDLYNAAAAVEERNGKAIAGLDRHAHADELLTHAGVNSDERSHVGRAWTSILENLGNLA